MLKLKMLQNCDTVYMSKMYCCVYSTLQTLHFKRSSITLKASICLFDFKGTDETLVATMWMMKWKKQQNLKWLIKYVSNT